MAQLVQLADKDSNTIYPQTTAAAIIDGTQKFLSAEQGLGFNQNIGNIADRVSKIEGDNTSWSPWSKDGMSLLNGAQIFNSDWDYPQYRTRKVNGTLQVEITFRVKGITVEGDTPYVGFPSNLKPVFQAHRGYSFPTTNGRTASWVLGDGTIKLHSTSDHNMDTGFWYPFHAIWEVEQ